ncbi:unnamed protein product, partial [Didymodactylos carnosus]
MSRNRSHTASIASTASITSMPPPRQSQRLSNKITAPLSHSSPISVRKQQVQSSTSTRKSRRTSISISITPKDESVLLIGNDDMQTSTSDLTNSHRQLQNSDNEEEQIEDDINNNDQKRILNDSTASDLTLIIKNKKRKKTTTVTMDEILSNFIKVNDQLQCKHCTEPKITAFLDPQLYDYLARYPEDLEKAEKEVLRVAKSQVLSHSRLPLNVLDHFLNTCGAGVTTATTTVSSTPRDFNIKEQLAVYIANHKNIPDLQSFWKRHELLLPDLARLVKRYSCIQPSSVSSESAFSVAGFINRKTRCSLAPDALRYSMFLKSIYQS